MGTMSAVSLAPHALRLRVSEEPRADGLSSERVVETKVAANGLQGPGPVSGLMGGAHDEQSGQWTEHGGGAAGCPLPAETSCQVCWAPLKALGMCTGHRLLLLSPPFSVSGVLGGRSAVLAACTMLAASCVVNSGTVPLPFASSSPTPLLSALWLPGLHPHFPAWPDLHPLWYSCPVPRPQGPSSIPSPVAGSTPPFSEVVMGVRQGSSVNAGHFNS